MNTLGFIQYTNDVYSSIFPEFSDTGYSSVVYHPKLEDIPTVHDLAHLLSGALGGPDNNYTFTEFIAIAIEYGLMQNFHLGDRHLDSSFFAQKTNKLHNYAYTNIFGDRNSDKNKYPAVDRAIFRNEHEMRIYSYLAYNYMLYLTDSLMNDLVTIGFEFGECLKRDFQMDMVRWIDTDKDFFDQYPTCSDYYKSESLIHNEMVLRQTLNKLPISELYSRFFNIAAKYPEVVNNLKEIQAIFLHVVFGHTPEFCSGQLRLKFFPEKFIIWKQLDNFKLQFDVEKAKEILRVVYL